MGKAILAFLPEERCEELIERIGPPASALSRILNGGSGGGALALLGGCAQSPPTYYQPTPLAVSRYATATAAVNAYLRELEFRREQAMQQYAPPAPPPPA